MFPPLGHLYLGGPAAPGTVVPVPVVLAVALPVDPLQTPKFVVDNGPKNRWWMVFVGLLVAFSAAKRAFVAPIWWK